MLSNRFVGSAFALLLVVGVSLDIYMGITQRRSVQGDLAWGIVSGVSAFPPVAVRAAMALSVLLGAISLFGRLGQTP